MSRLVPLLAASAALLVLAACEPGGKITQQNGYRGAGLQQVYDPDNFGVPADLPAPPYDLPPDGGPRATETYQNVQVLTDMSTDRFNHLMAAITQWVSPDQGCAYCHDPADMAADTVYTKVVARRMLAMTRNINGRWSDHVGTTGVTCYTCHRGQPVPALVWAQTDQGDPMSVRGQRHGQNMPNANVGYSSLPHDVFNRYLSGDPRVVRVASNSAYPSPAHNVSLKSAEDSFGVMIHLSEALGVNCTHCHNSQSFQSWSQSRAQRATAWYGIRMTRDVNQGYITPLTSVFPASRLGPMGDPYKVNCLTCHRGQAKPLGGLQMLADYPYLRPPAPVSVADQLVEGDVLSEVLGQPEDLTDQSGAPTVQNQE